MTAYVCTAPAVQANCGPEHVLVLRGEVIPPTVDPVQLKHLLDMGMVEEIPDGAVGHKAALTGATTPWRAT